MEWVNRELEVYLWIFCKRIPEDWDKHLPIAKFSYNGWPHSVTKWTPFYLMHGCEPTGVPPTFSKTNVPAVEQRLSELLKARDDAWAAHELAQQAQIKWSKKNSPPFSKGDRVWLDGQHLNRGHKFPKMDSLWEGPFEILEVLGLGDIQVATSNSMEHSQHVSWKTSYPISWNWCSWKEFPWTTTWSYWWRRRIWSRINQRSQKTRQRLSVFGSMEGILWWNLRIRKQSEECLRDSSKL